MANVERRGAAHHYTIDVILNEDERDELLRLRNAGTGDRASFTVTVGPPREMVEEDRRPKMRRRRPVNLHPAVAQGIRDLYADYKKSGLSLERYATEVLDCSRVKVWHWFNRLVLKPNEDSREKVMARTGIDIWLGTSKQP